jgi:hypothetical protein
MQASQEPEAENKECMGIMNYHRINELRESFPDQDYQAKQEYVLARMY